MNVYQTDSAGVFVGTTTADQDPLDATNMLIPAGCVEIAPPSFTEGQLVRWSGSSWTVEDIPKPAPEAEPELPDLAEDARTKRNRLLTSSDWTQVADAPVDTATWATYRQSLRDVPTQAGFPDTITWPAEPTQQDGV